MYGSSTCTGPQEEQQAQRGDDQRDPDPALRAHEDDRLAQLVERAERSAPGAGSERTWSIQISAAPRRTSPSR